ncbi:hypothetical protein [Pseudomonas sp. Eqa60]|uniref:hypothetical protein n=1 Tax=Pseudomonas sp. Eqa60 TaxID=2799184 RepID=UPI001FD23457|nr:hypothetical protein [Pseudomonas sp. Eqa60]
MTAAGLGLFGELDALAQQVQVQFGDAGRDGRKNLGHLDLLFMGRSRHSNGGEKNVSH